MPQCTRRTGAGKVFFALAICVPRIVLSLRARLCSRGCNYSTAADSEGFELEWNGELDGHQSSVCLNGDKDAVCF